MQTLRADCSTSNPGCQHQNSDQVKNKSIHVKKEENPKSYECIAFIRPNNFTKQRQIFEFRPILIQEDGQTSKEKGIKSMFESNLYTRCHFLIKYQRICSHTFCIFWIMYRNVMKVQQGLHQKLAKNKYQAGNCGGCVCSFLEM